jgi:uncharacterized membrane protein YdjX (TVP38/TMEM64 family)
MASGDQGRVESWVRGYGALGVVVVMGAMLMQALVPVLPSLVTIVAAVLAYGPIWGSLLAWAGMLMTASLMFGAGRCIAEGAPDAWLRTSKRRRMLSLIQRWGALAVVVARLTPVLSSDLVSFVAGGVRLPYLRFLLATGIGTIPLIAVIAIFSRNMHQLKTALAVVSVVAVVAVIGYAAVHWFRQRRDEPQPLA